MRQTAAALAFMAMAALHAAPAAAQTASRWAEPVEGEAEQALASEMIGALRGSDWLTAAALADRYQAKRDTGFSQYQAFFYAMTGRPDLVARMQREGRLSSAADCAPGADRAMEDAVEAILAAAAGHRAVVIQEMHWEARHRALLHHLLPRLREMGFSVLAAEDFEGGPEGYDAIAYPGAAPGFHSTREPVFADAVRQAIALGYRLTPYEASFPPPADVEPRMFQAYRSEQQAANLHARIFAGDPDVKAIIWAGVGWAREQGHPDYPGDNPMVAQLETLADIEALTIDQTACVAPGPGFASVAFEAAGAPVVQDFPPGTFDMQVRHHRADDNSAGRADWLAGLGRTPAAPPAALGLSGAAAVIEARPAGEPEGASPSDRLYLAAGETLPLMLAPGDYVVTAYEAGRDPRTARLTIDAEAAPADQSARGSGGH